MYNIKSEDEDDAAHIFRSWMPQVTWEGTESGDSGEFDLCFNLDN